MISLEHIGICAKDTVVLKNWYIKLFNFKTVYDNKKDKPTYFLLMEDNNMIEIYPMEHNSYCEGKKYKGLRHIAFKTNAIEEEYQKLLDNNVKILEEPATSINGVKTVWFSDPEGNILHFIQRAVELY